MSVYRTQVRRHLDGDYCTDLDWLADYADAIALDLRDIDPYRVFHHVLRNARRHPEFTAQLVCTMAALMDPEEPAQRRAERVTAITAPHSGLVSA